MPLDLQGIFGILDTVANTDRRYTTNRRRCAVVAYEGFRLGDFVAEHQSSIHVVSSCGAILFAGIGVFRCKHGTEACTLWLSLSALCGGIAWYTRPVEVVVVGPDGKPSATKTEPKALNMVKDWLDARAGSLDKDAPGWDDRTVKRVLEG